MSVHPDHGAGYPPAYAQPQYQPMMNQPMPPAMMNQQQTTTNIVMINQPQVQGQKLILGPVSGHRNWTTDLFSCCEDIGSCKIYGIKLFVCLFLINTLPYNPYFGTPLEKKAFYFRLPAFSFFPTMFSKAFFLKSGLYGVKRCKIQFY